MAALVVFAQGPTRAYTVLNFFEFGAHMTSGYVTGIFALAAVVLAFAAKPKYDALRYSPLALFALVVIQGLIGFSAETSDEIVGIHFVNFLVLFGISIAMVFYAFRWNMMGSAPQPQSGRAATGGVGRVRDSNRETDITSVGPHTHTPTNDERLHISNSAFEQSIAIATKIVSSGRIPEYPLSLL